MVEKHHLTDEELLDELNSRFELNKEALDELKTKTEQLQNVNKKLKESESLKSHFLSNVTNEIVNPFASILGLSQSIISLNISDYDRIRPLAQLIHSEAFNLDFQLKNIFAAAKIEAGLAQPELALVNVGSLIEGIIDNYQYKARQKELKIEFTYQLKSGLGCAGNFPTDSEKIKLIISNMLNNSIKYSNATSKIEIVTAIDKLGELVITVKDYGVGISAYNQEKLFDRFEKGENNINSLNEGYGLGLSIAKAYIDSLEGKIEVVSFPGEGSTFTVRIPRPDETRYLTGFSDDGNQVFFDDTDEEF